MPGQWLSLLQRLAPPGRWVRVRRCRPAFFGDRPRSVLATLTHLLPELYPDEKDKRWTEPRMPDLLGEHLVRPELEKGAAKLLELAPGPRKA